MEDPVEKQRTRFYGLPLEGDPPPEPGTRPKLRIVLDRRLVEREKRDWLTFRKRTVQTEEFVLQRRIGYTTRHYGDVVVPGPDTEAFTTDLTSVPPLFTWLVPKTGAHLPAALIHDGIVEDKFQRTPTYEAVDKHGNPVVIHRDGADEIFRDAMADTGTGIIRRWVVWSAVTVATMILGKQVPHWSTRQRWQYRIAAITMVGTVAVLGVWATLDLFDLTGEHSLWWMGERDASLELLGGLAGGVAIPLIIGVFWGRFFAAGWIAGPLMAVVIPVTFVVGPAAAAYVVAERFAGSRPFLARIVGVFTAIVAVLLWLFLSLFEPP
jgi:Protein of unknown function (DUF1353)